jgi:uncharacterized pyridoxal phosphate-containing UPF0001 family protein
VNDVAGVADRLAAVRARLVAAGGDLDAITVVAVTKGFGADAVRDALDAGLAVIGENYARELQDKAAELDAALPAGAVRPQWHFLGTIQRNKVARLAPVVAVWQSVSRPEEAQAIARASPGAAVLVEVECTGLPGRNGCAPAAVPDLVAMARTAGLEVRGLMTVAPPDPPGAAAAFGVVRELADRMGLVERSMGMTDDLELAVAHGTTMVRVGRALFGPRPPRAGAR